MHTRWKLLWSLVFCMCVSTVSAQQKLLVQGTKGNTYFWYRPWSDAALHNISALFRTDLIAILYFNDIISNRRIPFGNNIKIPFHAHLLKQDEDAPELPTAVVHKVATGENLYRISLAYNNVPLSVLKKWNGLPQDAIVEEGDEIIVGFLPLEGYGLASGRIKVYRDMAVNTSLRTSGTYNNTINNNTRTLSNTPVTERTNDPGRPGYNTVPPANNMLKKNDAAVRNTVRNNPVASTDNRNRTQKNVVENVGTDRNKNKPVALPSSKPVDRTDISNNDRTIHKNDLRQQNYDSFKKALDRSGSLRTDSGTADNTRTDQSNSINIPRSSNNDSGKRLLDTGKKISEFIVGGENSTSTTNSSTQTEKIKITITPVEGVFASNFIEEMKGRTLVTRTGIATTFKSATGWQDKRYYILGNGLPQGSYVKVSNGSKIIYAKVLWNVGDLKVYEGLEFRISDATAAALGLTGVRFPIAVTMYN